MYKKMSQTIILVKCEKCGTFSSSSICECITNDKVSQLEHRLEEMEVNMVLMKEDMSQKVSDLESRIITLSSLLLK
jgi:hypothetical protein